MNMKQTIDITPNWDPLARHMLRAAGHEGDALIRRGTAKEIRLVQRVLAPLNVAAQSVTSTDMLAQFREVLAGIVAGLDERANALEDAPEGWAFVETSTPQEDR